MGRPVKISLAFVAASIPGLILAQKLSDHPAQVAARGTHGAIAAGSGYATEAGMRMYYAGGNAVDAGVASIFAAATTEYSHVGLGRGSAHSDSHAGRQGSRYCGRGHHAEAGHGRLLP